MQNNGLLQGQVGLAWKKDDEFISLIKTFMNQLQALAYVQENHRKYGEEWEPVETHVTKLPSGSFRAELIYRKRQGELNV